ncbi:MAG: hypothetical protein LBQ12_11900 [Deltaproteobacteria bacterium]|jgi:hypothetical protein|nr:hypothetical protein [Deltaproteobacteria bacterium]
MGTRLETERRAFGAFTIFRDTCGAAHGWDGMRALARLVFGPKDARVWACQARSASELAAFTLADECLFAQIRRWIWELTGPPPPQDHLPSTPGPHSRLPDNRLLPNTGHPLELKKKFVICNSVPTIPQYR